MLKESLKKSQKERSFLIIFYTFGQCCSRRFEYGWHVSNIKQLKCKFLLFASISHIQKINRLFFSIPFQLSNYPIYFLQPTSYTGTTYKLCEGWIIPMQCWSLSSQNSLRFIGPRVVMGSPGALSMGSSVVCDATRVVVWVWMPDIFYM